MGLIKAAVSAGSSVLADQWKEYFACDSLPENVLMTRGYRKTGKRSSNKGNEGVISNGSVIAVADGQAMMIVEDGRVVEFTAEPGVFTYDSSSEPSVFSGSLGKSIKDSFKAFGRRFTFGGDLGRDQRVYYFNTKEILNNKYGTPAPVPFRVVDANIGLDLDASLRCNGEYTYRITDPILFYKSLAGNVSGDYTRDMLDGQLKSQFLTCLQPAFARISAMGIRYSALPAHTLEISEAMDDALTAKWSGQRGISIVSVSVNSVSLSADDEAMIKELQKTAVFRNAGMGAAYTTMAQGEAMKSAAANSAGAFTGFIGMGMAQQAGGVNAAELYKMAEKQQAAAPAPAPAAPAAKGWKCSCGAENTGKFCTECGAKKPDEGWKCSCGSVNKGKFCPECGAKKPAGIPQYRCDKCGWQPEDPTKAPKFCPECGDVFDNGDIV